MTAVEGNPGLVGRVMLGGAVVLGVLAVLCWSGVLPVDHGARRAITLALGLAAAADGMLGVVFLMKSRHS